MTRSSSRPGPRSCGVDFAGYLPDADLAAAVAAADAVVLPSHYEPFGIVALEAAAAGAPLVVARSGGLAEVVVDGETGVSFPPRDVAGLADAVVPPARRPARRPRAGRRGRGSGWRRTSPGTSSPPGTAAVYAAARRRPPAALGRPVIPTDDALRHVLGAP